jgi:uncharacterized protein (DUF736 family)
MRIDFDKMVLKKLSTIKIGETIKVSDLAKKDPDGFIQAVKRLIRAGWSEYEFSNDYLSVRRLDLPDFARAFFKKLKDEHSKTITRTD